MYSASFDVNFVFLRYTVFEISKKRAVEHQNDAIMKK